MKDKDYPTTIHRTTGDKLYRVTVQAGSMGEYVHLVRADNIGDVRSFMKRRGGYSMNLDSRGYGIVSIKHLPQPKTAKAKRKKRRKAKSPAKTGRAGSRRKGIVLTIWNQIRKGTVERWQVLPILAVVGALVGISILNGPGPRIVRGPK